MPNLPLDNLPLNTTTRHESINSPRRECRIKHGLQPNSPPIERAISPQRREHRRFQRPGSVRKNSLGEFSLVCRVGDVVEEVRDYWVEGEEAWAGL